MARHYLGPKPSPFVLCVIEIEEKSEFAAIEYAKMIDDFDDLVDLRTMAHHYLSPKPSPFILRAIEIKEKSEFPSFPFYYYYYIFWSCRDDNQI